MSSGNFVVILMVILVAIVCVGGAFIAMYFLNKAVRQHDREAAAACAEARSKGE
jgi:flagellar basal body-associated protein FliL